MTGTVTDADFTRDFDRYRSLAQREAVAISSDGSIAGYFIAPDEYEAFRRFKDRRRSFSTVDLTEAEVAEISAARMDDRHAHLDTLLDGD